MKISLNLPNLNFNTKQMKYYPNLSPLKFDTVSFSAMKKNQFSEIDLMMINRQKAPIEKFNTNDDFQSWCKDKVQNEYISKKDELAKSVDPQAQIQKAKILDDWIEYITVENEAYTPAIQLMILSSITSDLSKDTNHLPPVLDKRILADTIYEITQNCKKDKNYNPNFNKLYRNKLQTGIMQEETNLDTSLSGWIVIPSKGNDPDNFEENVKKLQTLSHDNWCTKTYNAQPYLAEGDFHIYMEQGKPKLGVRTHKNTIVEIQGEKNNKKIPLKYLEVVKTHIDETDFKVLYDVPLKQAENAKRRAAKLESKLKKQGSDFKTCSTKELLCAIGIKCEENEDGKLIINTYHQPDTDFTFEDIGINENKLFKDIVEIKGNVEFRDSAVTNLGSLRIIRGNADFKDSKVINLGALEIIEGDAIFFNSKIKDLGQLRTIGANTSFYNNHEITDLGNIETIGGNADFGYSVIKDLANLQIIKGNANFKYSKVVNLGELKAIEGDACFSLSEITSLGSLETIDGDASFHSPNLTDLGSLKGIGGDADFAYSGIKDLANLEKIKGNANFKNSEVVSLGNLKAIEGNANFKFSKITDLGDLETIGQDAEFKNSQVVNLGSLKRIGGNAGFIRSKIRTLGLLETIGGDANFEFSDIADLGCLKIIKGNAYFNKSKVTDLGNLETIGGKAYFKGSEIKNFGKLKSVKGRGIENFKFPAKKRNI